MNTVIDFRSVNFSYGSVPTLSAINLQVEEGEFLGVVGPNAGGKSTLLRLMLGLLQPQSGSIRILDERRARPAGCWVTCHSIRVFHAISRSRSNTSCSWGGWAWGRAAAGGMRYGPGGYPTQIMRRCVTR